MRNALTQSPNIKDAHHLALQLRSICVGLNLHQHNMTLPNTEEAEALSGMLQLASRTADELASALDDLANGLDATAPTEVAA